MRFEPNWKAWLCENPNCKVVLLDYLSMKYHEEIACEYKQPKQINKPNPTSDSHE